MLEYSKSGIYNNNRLPAEKKKEEKEKENTRDRSVPDGSDNQIVYGGRSYIITHENVDGTSIVEEHSVSVLTWPGSSV